MRDDWDSYLQQLRDTWSLIDRINRNEEITGKDLTRIRNHKLKKRIIDAIIKRKVKWMHGT